LFETFKIFEVQIFEILDQHFGLHSKTFECTN